MTPKEKADELYNKFYVWYPNQDAQFIAVKCALLAVVEILNSEPRYPSDVDWDDVGGTHQYYYEAQREEADKFWIEVKKEIEKL